MNFALTKEQETLKKGLAILLEERGHVYGEEMCIRDSLMTVVLIYYSFRLLFLQDVDSIYGKNKKKPKDKEGFAKAAGKLMVFLAAASLGMAVSCV